MSVTIERTPVPQEEPVFSSVLPKKVDFSRSQKARVAAMVSSGHIGSTHVNEEDNTLNVPLLLETERERFALEGKDFGDREAVLLSLEGYKFKNATVQRLVHKENALKIIRLQLAQEIGRTFPVFAYSQPGAKEKEAQPLRKIPTLMEKLTVFYKKAEEHGRHEVAEEDDLWIHMGPDLQEKKETFIIPEDLVDAAIILSALGVGYLVMIGQADLGRYTNLLGKATLRFDRSYVDAHGRNIEDLLSCFPQWKRMQKDAENYQNELARYASESLSVRVKEFARRSLGKVKVRTATRAAAVVITLTTMVGVLSKDIVAQQYYSGIDEPENPPGMVTQTPQYELQVSGLVQGAQATSEISEQRNEYQQAINKPGLVVASGAPRVVFDAGSTAVSDIASTVGEQQLRKSEENNVKTKGSKMARMFENWFGKPKPKEFQRVLNPD